MGSKILELEFDHKVPLIEMDKGYYHYYYCIVNSIRR
jgi:hypothetical protein